MVNKGVDVKMLPFVDDTWFMCQVKLILVIKNILLVFELALRLKINFF